MKKIVEKFLSAVNFVNLENFYLEYIFGNYPATSFTLGIE